MYYSVLLQRGLIKISGEDKTDFLQGIVTNDIRLVGDDKLVYSTFLTPQGKYLADFFIMQIEDDLFLDIDKSLLSFLIARMGMYKLRSRVTLTDVSEQYKILAFWGDKKPSLTVLQDPRTKTIGWRGYFMADEAVQFGTITQGDYDTWRLGENVPDVKDFERERSTLAETNLDLLNAVSFNKGCYIGQELTARVEYRGLVKKRLVLLKTMEDITSVFDTPVLRGKKTIGHLRSAHGNMALALLQLDGLADGMSVSIDGQDAVVSLPEWFTQP